MSLVLDATVGWESANTYVTLAEAEAYFEGRTHSDVWYDASASEQEVALVRAARELDLLNWVGSAVTSTQARAWPRWEVTLRNGFRAASDAIPLDIKDAQCELALAFLAPDSDDPMAADDSARLSSLSVGSVSMTFNGSQPLPGPRSYPAVMARVGPYIAGGMGGSIVRA